MRYGHFDDVNREYVITRPDTPLPWINYLGCESYFGIISNTAGGYSFYRDARLRRITRYRYNNLPLDLGGRYIYLRDNQSQEFWSPSWQPTRHELQDYSCRHGLGYSIIGSTYRDIEAHTRYFVPLGEDLEIWQLTVTNHRRNRAASPRAAARAPWRPRRRARLRRSRVRRGEHPVFLRRCEAEAAPSTAPRAPPRSRPLPRRRARPAPGRGRSRGRRGRGRRRRRPDSA